MAESSGCFFPRPFRSFRKHPGVALFFLAAVFFIAPAARGASRTENVFIVIIDGVRNKEAFEAGNRYIPMLWDSLRPQGALYTRFWNRGVTVTSSAYSTIVTGVRQKCPNNLDMPPSIRPEHPTVGEYFLKEFGLSSKHAVFFNGDKTIWRDPVSLFPGYGRGTAPSVVASTIVDSSTFQTASDVVFRDHPSLVYLPFFATDYAGHTGNWDLYTSSIKKADRLIFQLWKRIQADSVYGGRTTMMVMSDHGRNEDDDANKNWREHGNWSHGCRHLMFLAVGPDIKPNTVITEDRDQTDVAPTVGALLGFSTPFAKGRILSDMLTFSPPEPSVYSGKPGSAEINLSRSTGVSGPCSIARSKAGMAVVYSETVQGRTEIRAARSDGTGNTWTAPAVLASAAKADYAESSIIALGDSGLFVAYSGPEYRSFDSTFAWVVRGTHSTDFGKTWRWPWLIDMPETMAGRTALQARGGKTVSIDVNHQYALFHTTFAADGDPVKGTRFGSSTIAFEPAGGFAGADGFAIWRGIHGAAPASFDLYMNAEPWSSPDTRLTAHSKDAYSYYPSAVCDNSRISLLYNFLPDSRLDNLWRARFMRINADGRAASEPVDISGQGVAYRPVIRQSDNGKIVALWAAVQPNGWTLTYSFTTDGGGTWSLPSRAGNRLALIGAFDFCVGADTLYMVWEDMRGGNSDIFFRKWTLGAREPASPVLDYPSDMADTVALDVQFRWKAVPGASTYRLQVSRDSVFMKLVMDESELAAPFAAARGLSDNTVYYWRVNAANEAGTGGWSPFRRFKTAVPSAAAAFQSASSTRCSLSQNYPNPFNASTRFRFVLSRAGAVRLEVFNLNGERVKSVLDAFFPEGEHAVEWIPEGLTSGVYFFRMEAEGFSEVKKAILAR